LKNGKQSEYGDDLIVTPWPAQENAFTKCQVGRHFTVKMEKLPELIGTLLGGMEKICDVMTCAFEIKGSGSLLDVVVRLDEIETGYPLVWSMQWNELEQDLRAYHQVCADKETQTSTIVTLCYDNGLFAHPTPNPNITG